MLESLLSEQRWEEYLAFKTEKGHLTKRELEDLRTFVEQKEYVPAAERVCAGGHLGMPRVAQVNKGGTGRKRTVFTFGREENYLLKLLAYLLREYDDLFPDNLYSFRRDTGVKDAIKRIARTPGLAKMYSYKADIRDYFHSVDTEQMVSMVREVFRREPDMAELLTAMLQDPYALRDGRPEKVKKGIMAGVPTAGFLADLYLAELDRWFAGCGVLYARYSDDMIVFGNTAEEIAVYEEKIKSFLSERKLEINEDKEFRTMPGEPWEFLGFSFSDSDVDISGAALKKLKGKLKRKARALYRWKIKKGASGERAARAYIRYLNRKFYEKPFPGEITWCRWYFPVITTSESLQVIDSYVLDLIRYLYTGRYSRKNYKLSYETIRDMGFRSLVNRYWRYRKEG